MIAQELRIGNWVNSIAGGLRGGYGKVRGIEGEGALIMLKQGHLKPLASELLCGIPLTEEILLKCGFQVMESSSAKEFYIGINPVTKDWLFSLVWLERPDLIKAPDAPFYRNGAHTIYHVHQLQNLYFALTGEELQISL